ncbi:hypothetical protein FACS189485_20170 [Spirochaetia bacterium]|nr:hypothetical protein FACS189485_20170 [Spirochaetia bacterium]
MYFINTIIKNTNKIIAINPIIQKTYEIYANIARPKGTVSGSEYSSTVH